MLNQNPETIGIKLAEKAIALADVDTGIHILSKALEQLCLKLAHEMQSEKPKQLALSAANYARVCRQLADQSRDTQHIIATAN